MVKAIQLKCGGEDGDTCESPALSMAPSAMFPLMIAERCGRRGHTEYKTMNTLHMPLLQRCHTGDQISLVLLANPDQGYKGIAV